MQISGLNLFNNKRQLLSNIQGNNDNNVSIFASKLSSVNSDNIEDYVNKGMTVSAIVSKIVGSISENDELKEFAEFIE